RRTAFGAPARSGTPGPGGPGPEGLRRPASGEDAGRRRLPVGPEGRVPSRPELALQVESRDGRHRLPFPVRRVVCGGYVSRDRAEVERHIQELERLGIPRPQEIPIFFSVSSYLVTTGDIAEVQGPFTSGEVEFVLLFGPGGPWVTVGSDQTDRFFERHSVPASKQLCPKLVAPTVWPVAEVEEHWDELVLRSWWRSGRNGGLNRA